jgi:hypothetical protein
MRRDDISEALGKAPFRPFVLCLANGERIEIRHPEMCAVGGRTAVVVEPDDRRHDIDIALVVKLETAPLAPAGAISPPPDGGE